MLRTFFVIAMLCCFCTVSLFAQNRAGASQTIQLEFRPAMDIQISEASAAQELTVRSNKAFRISVQKLIHDLSGQKQASKASQSGDKGVSMKIVSNATGGTANSLFAGGYTPVTSSAQDLVMNASRGDKQVLAFAYQAKQGNETAGAQPVGVVYTATQP